MKSREISANEASLDSADLDVSQSSQQETATDERMHESIAKLAYALWEQRGCPIGSSEQDWIQAQQEILQPAEQAVGAGR